MKKLLLILFILPFLSKAPPVDMSSMTDEFVDLSNGVSANQWTRYFKPNSDWLTQGSIELMNAYRGVGVKTIRIPLDPLGTLMIPGNFDSLNMARLPTLDTLVNRALARGFTVIIDPIHLLGGSPNLFHYAYIDTLGYRTGFMRYWRAVANHYKSYSSTKLVYEVWNEPANPGSSRVQSQCYALQDSIVKYIRSVDTLHWVGCTGTSGSGHGEHNYVIAGNHYLNPLSYSKVFYIFHFYQPNLFVFQGKQSANDQGTYNYPYWSTITAAQATAWGDSVSQFDCVGCNGIYSIGGIGTLGEIWTASHTHVWNYQFMDRLLNSIAQYGRTNHTFMWNGEYMAFQYGNGVTTGTLRQYRLNWMDDCNSICRKYGISCNAWDPTGAAVRIDSNQAVQPPFIFDTTLLRRMGYINNQ